MDFHLDEMMKPGNGPVSVYRRSGELLAKGMLDMFICEYTGVPNWFVAGKCGFVEADIVDVNHEWSTITLAWS